MSANQVTVTQVLPVVRDLADDASLDDQAEAIGLHLVSDDEPGVRRIRRGRGFSYHDPDGELIAGPARERVEDLAIPPAWTDVWICPDPAGHLQATGRDDAGRKQYLYHPVWRQLREAAKFDRLAEVGDALPTVRASVDADLRRRRLSSRRVTALVVALLDSTLIGVGNEEYARSNEAYGLTTLRREHAEVTSSSVTFSFTGKSGKEHEVCVADRRLARQLSRVLSDHDDERLFVRVDGGTPRPLDSDEVNRYLSEIGDGDLTAKDFRTWGGTVVATQRLRDLGPAGDEREAEANVLTAIDATADRLGNTRAVARASYVHPFVPKAYRFGRFAEAWDGRGDVVDRLSPAERAVRRIIAMDLPPSDDVDRLLEASLERTS